ncbi:hypothetical protein NSQ62_08205 [Solibacillus sp. FSL H8-0523]|uniref:hypothetical protein n=1 Tax=Solibacillus sp. FSL H8-0523 TaxID=2954511 RepID=UPI003100C27F
MKNLALTGILAVTSMFSVFQVEPGVLESKYAVNELCEYVSPNYCGNNSLTNGLQPNQTTLFYMYSNDTGHYFLDPLAEYENVIYVGRSDHLAIPDLTVSVENLHHGKRYIGTFADNELWELVGLTEVTYEQ